MKLTTGHELVIPSPRQLFGPRGTWLCVLRVPIHLKISSKFDQSLFMHYRGTIGGFTGLLVVAIENLDPLLGRCLPKHIPYVRVYLAEP